MLVRAIFSVGYGEEGQLYKGVVCVMLVGMEKKVYHTFFKQFREMNRTKLY